VENLVFFNAGRTTKATQLQLVLLRTVCCKCSLGFRSY